MDNKKKFLLELLQKVSKEDINSIIESNGKKIKLVNPFIKVKR